MQNNQGMKKNIKNATVWSTITEIVAKLISPITNMILARLLTPEIFGIVASVTLVFTFADMFTDAGFQKYIVQHELKDQKDLFRNADVAFWSNLAVSMMFWLVISIFSENIASLTGCEGLGILFVVSCVSLPLTSFSSIQMAIYRRNFDFKMLFKVRLVGVLIPILVTVPIAFFTHSYWALIIGTICGNLANAVILTVWSKWKPHFFYSFKMLKQMLSFSMWSLVEAISIWLINYVGIFIVGTMLSQYYLGLYKTSMTTVNQFTSVITAAFTPVIFSALSRMQNDSEKFKETFLKFQRLTSYLVVPMGIGIFLYRDLVTKILLGDQWSEAADFIGLWGVVSTIKIIYSNYCYEVYRAKGRPKLAILAQVCQLVVLVPVIYFTATIGFVPLYIARSLIVIELLIVNQFIMHFACGFSTWEMIKNTYHSFVASVLMSGAAILLQMVSTNILWSIASIFICIGVYFLSFRLLFSRQFKEMLSVGTGVLKKKSRKNTKKAESDNE